MSCLAPIRIRDRVIGRYHGRDRYITVPCGHCVECARARRNDWFVRLWSVYCTLHKLGVPAWFVTVTIDPSLWPGMTVDSPGISDRISPFMRSWCERLRYLNGGKMPLRFLCSEFGSKGEIYSDFHGRYRITTGALHFHGLLFGNLPIKVIQDGLSITHGHVKFERMRGPECIRYTVKYSTKDYSIEDPRLRSRTFASPGLGVPEFYFGDQPATNIVSINGFHYRTPRYLKDLQWLRLYCRFLHGSIDKSSMALTRKENVTPFGHTLISLENASKRLKLMDDFDRMEDFYANCDSSLRSYHYSTLIKQSQNFKTFSQLKLLIDQKLVGKGHSDYVRRQCALLDDTWRSSICMDRSFGNVPYGDYVISILTTLKL